MNKLNQFDRCSLTGTLSATIKYFTAGKTVVFFDDALTMIEEIRVGSKHLVLWADKQTWLAKHPKIAERAEKELKARRTAVDAWRAETPHLQYSADGGCFALRANGVLFKVRNRHGDVTGASVFVLERGEVFAPDFQFVAEVADGEIDLLAYDVKPDRAVARLHGPIDIYVGDNGDVVIVKTGI